jgi:hypothetical protein
MSRHDCNEKEGRTMRTATVWVGLALALSGLGLVAGCALFGSSDANDWSQENAATAEIRRLTESWICQEPYLDLDQVGDIDMAKLSAVRNTDTSAETRSVRAAAVPVSSRVVSDIQVRMAKDGHEAIAQCREETTYMIDGSPVVRAAEITAVYERLADGWQLVQVSRADPDRP